MKFMLLQSYAATEVVSEPMSSWAPEDVKAHIEFQRSLNKELTKRGELVDAQALAGPDLVKIVTHDGAGTRPARGARPPARDGRRRGRRAGRVPNLNRAAAAPTGRGRDRGARPW